MMEISNKIWAQFKLGELIVETSAAFGGQKPVILQIALGNMFFGDVVSSFAGLVTGQRDFSLPAPWNFLDNIPLNDLTLCIDITNSQIGIRYDLKKNFSFIKIQSFELWCSLQKKSLDLKIFGDFLGQTYDDKPLAWDVLNDDPPLVPGQGKALLELDYLGLGQRVALENAENLQSVSEIIDVMIAKAGPIKENAEDPVSQLKQQGLAFCRDSHWLIGTKFKLMDTIDLSAVFNDPEIYGLVVSLSGEKAAAFDGLSFEILYKKVTENIGVYHLELKLPDTMRQLEFGALSVTLASITIDIYTNGNFRLDFGFPRGLDFSRSCSVQAFPYLGFGGFYFALLTGATAKRLPQIANGTFHPVIEFGLGIAIGVGKTIERGVLKAGFFISVTGILEGIIAWFNPEDKAKASEQYYWLQGTVVITGKLYGEIDFKLIKVNVSVEAYAAAAMVIEAYEPIPITIEVGVAVAATLQVLFIKIHFTFELQLRERFLIGSKGTPPWRIIEGPKPDRQLGSQRSLYRSKPCSTKDVARLTKVRRTGLEAQLLAQEGFDWTPVNIFNKEKKDLSLSLLPAFTVADTDDGISQMQAVMLLFAQNSIENGAASAKDALKVNTPEAQNTPFNLLVQSMLAWAMQAQWRSQKQNITAADLEDIYRELSLAQTGHPAFSYANLSEFLRLNFSFKIDGQLDREPNDKKSATIVPMLPVLSMKTSNGLSVNFSTWNMVDQTYEKNIVAYFKSLAIDSESNTAKDPLQGAGPPPGSREGEETGRDICESVATVIFRDYFSMLATAAVQSAIDLLKAYPFFIEGGESLAGIVDSFPRMKFVYTVRDYDTLETITALLGVSSLTLVHLNPEVDFSKPLLSGTRLTAQAGVTVDSLAIANQSRPLRAGTELIIGGIRYQVKSGDTLWGIAERFIADQTEGKSLEGLAEAFLKGLAVCNRDRAIFQTGARLKVADLFYTIQEEDWLELIAAVFLVRNGGSGTETPPGWFERMIAELNPEVDFNKRLKTGTRMKIPRVRGTSKGIAHQPDTLPYRIKQGDSLERIARTFLAVAMRQPEVVELTKKIKQLNSEELDFEHPLPPGKKIAIPDFDYRIEAGDTLHKIASLFYTKPSLLVITNSATVDLLAPLVVLLLPEVHHPIGREQTLSDIAATYNLTVAELAQKIAATADIFPVGEVITVPEVSQVKIDQLLRDLVAHGACNTIAAMVSRFMLHGLSLPDPRGDKFMTQVVDQLPNEEPVIPKLTPLYQLAGQQLALPRNREEDFKIAFTNSGAADWIEFSPINPPAEQMTLCLSRKFCQDHSPSETFWPEFLKGPESLPLLHEMPVRYTLSKNIPWQSAESPPFAGKETANQGAGEPSIWLFPEILIKKASAEKDPTPYRLFNSMHENGSSMTKSPVNRYDWATALEIRVKQLPGKEIGTVMPNSYLMLGADQTGRDRLIGVWRHLNKKAEANGAYLYLLYPPNPAGTNPSGLVSDKLDRSQSYLLKTNLSTLTHSKYQQDAFKADAVKGETLSGLYFARIGAAKEFIRLLWECSVVGTGGFYLNYVNADNGAGLPQNLFADSNGATLWLIIILSSQCRAKSPDRNLYGFTNAVLVQDNIDAGQANIFTEAADNSDITKGATVPPGYVGFQLTRPNPESETPGPEQKTRSLYSLLSYRVVENDFFNGSPESLPIGPTYHEKNNANRDNQHAWLNTDEKNWQYHHVVPIYRFAKANPLPHCNALPSGTGTPYAGIAKDPATQRLAWVELGFTFRDLFGNSKTPEPKMPCLPIPVGYFDRLIGFSQWPGTSAAYTFNSADDSADGAPRLQVIFDLQITKYLPGPGTPFENAVKTASAHSEKFRQIYYQIEQEDVRFHLRTSLDQPLPGKEPQAYAVQKTILRHFVRAAYLFLSATQQLKAYEHRIEKGQTLEDIANAYAVKVIDLGKANQTTGSDSLFSEDLNIPKFQVVRHGETLSDIVSGTELDVERLAKNNRYIPLNPGKKISGYTVLTGDTLETLSAKPNLGSIDQIARNNAFLPNLFEAGTALYLNSEPSPPEASLEDMADMYGITPAQLCDFNRQTPLKAGTSLRIPDLVFVEQPDLLFTAYLSGDGDTLCQIAEKYRQPPIKLVQLNLKLQGLFAPDQPITVGSHTVVTEAADTFISLLGKFKEVGLELSLTDLAKTIQGQPGLIPAGAFFVCPLPRAAAGDSIEKLALKFSATVESLARANSSLQGFLRRGAEIKIERNIEGQKQVFSTVARSYDTLNTLASRLCGKLQKIQNRSDRLPEPTIEEIAVENRLNTDLLVPDQEFILPPNPVIFSAKIAPHYPDTLFPVTVALEMTRDADLVDPEFKDVSEVWLNRTMIAPKTSTVTSGTLSLREFAKNFEQAFPGLKAATGIKKELDEDRSASGRLWAVNFGESGIRSFTIQGDRPRFFALKPLSTSLMAKKDVPIVSYRSGHGLDDQPKKHNFQTIDLDKWAQDFLSAVDRILSLEYAIPAFMLDSKAYEKIVAAKATIAEALKGQVDEILEPKGDKHREADLIDAREALYQRMLIKLSHAYETDTLIQLPVAVESNYLDKKTAPRFFGKPVSINETIAGPNPDYQLATAKVPLADGNQTVNFLFKVTSAEEQTKVPLNLIYQISEFEYDIQDNKGIEDYEASSWLSFILPIGQSPRQPLGINPHIGAIEVPIPLRCYPVPPTLVFQEGHAWWHPPKSTSGQPEIEQVKLWDYGITYEHQAAAQDSTYLKVVFNDVKNPDKRTKARKPDLFDTLAQFTAVYPDLRKDLEFLPTIQEGQGGDIATKAVQSFARLAIAVAEAWQLTSASRHDEKPDSRLIFNYSLDMKKTESSSLETLTLHAAPENPSVMWPRVFILIPDRQKVEQPLEMPIIVQTSQESVYKYPEASNTLGPFGSLRQKFVFEKCDVVHLQNAWGGVWITRNEHLIDSTHTNAGFVYRTPLVRFRNPMVPFLEYDGIIPINFSSGLKASLRSLFQSLFAATGKTWDKYSERSLTLTCSYDYELVASTPGETPIISRVPVLFQPRHYFKLDPEKPDWGDQRASFVEELCQAIETWEKNNPACRNGGSYVFEINLYSTLEPSLTQPLLKLKSLSYNLESDHFTKAP